MSNLQPQIVTILQILSGALAALIVGRFFLRRRAHVAVISVTPSARTGLKGESVRLEPQVKQIVDRFRWAGVGRRPLDQEDIVTMNQVLRRARLFKRASSQALAELDGGIATLSGGAPSREAIQTAVGRILGVHVLGRLLQGMTKRRTIVWPEVPKDLTSVPWLIPVQDEPIGGGFAGVSGRVILDCSAEFKVAWPYSDPYDRMAALQLAHGICNPDMANLRDNLRRVRDELLEDTTIADSVIAELAPLLLVSSRWVVTVQIANVGGSPVVLGPGAILSARSGGRRYGPLDLHVRETIAFASSSGSRTPTQTSLLGKLKDDENGDSNERDFNAFGVTMPADEDLSRANLVVAPNAQVNAVFFSTRRISEEVQYRELAEFWEKNLAEFRVAVTLRPRGMRVTPRLWSRWTEA